MPYLKEWRDGRAVECTGLENQQTFAGFQGSNPCLSASFSCLNLNTTGFLILL